MTTQSVYEAFYDLWRAAEQEATLEGQDIQQERRLWPSLNRIAVRVGRDTGERRSVATVRYHLQKLIYEGLIRRERWYSEVYRPQGLYFEEIEKAQL